MVCAVRRAVGIPVHPCTRWIPGSFWTSKSLWPRTWLLPVFCLERLVRVGRCFCLVTMKPKINYRLSIATGTHKGDRDHQQDRVEVLRHPYENSASWWWWPMEWADAGDPGIQAGCGKRPRNAQGSLTWKKDDPSVMRYGGLWRMPMSIRMLNVSSELEPHSTIAAHLLLPPGANHWVHSGDSRIYHFRKWTSADAHT